jgi:hypothetical protein
MRGPEPGEDARLAMSSQQLLVAVGEPDHRAGAPRPVGAQGPAGAPAPGPVVETGPDDQTWLPVFTSTEAARRWRPTVQVLGASGAQLLALAEQLGCAEVVVDPAGPDPLRVPARRAAARRPSIRPLSTPIGHDVLRRLDRELAGDQVVRRVWLVELALEGEDVLLVAFDVAASDQADADRIAANLRPRLAPLLPTALYDGVEFRALTDRQLAAEVAAADAPVYRRRPS